MIQQIEGDLFDAVLIAQDTDARRRVHLKPEADAPRRRTPRREASDTFHGAGQVNGVAPQRDLRRLDAGEIDQLGHQPLQRRRRGADGLHEVPLCRLQVGTCKGAGLSRHALQRRQNL